MYNAVDLKVCAGGSDFAASLRGSLMTELAEYAGGRLLGRSGVLWLSMTQVDEAKVPVSWKRTTSNLRILEFNAAAKEAAKEFGFRYLDMHALARLAPLRLWGDAVHLTGEGNRYYQYVAHLIWNTYSLLMSSDDGLGP